MRQIDELLNYGKSEKSEPEKSKPKLKALLEEVLLRCVVPTCGLNLSICIAPMFKDALGVFAWRCSALHVLGHNLPGSCFHMLNP
jgi:hypothetical protein